MSVVEDSPPAPAALAPIPVTIGAPRGGPPRSTVLRRDNWRLAPTVQALGLLAFVAYATWAAFRNANYYVGLVEGRNYLSPFYSPCIASNCPPAVRWGPITPSGWTITPAILILIFPLGFRLDLLLLPQGVLPLLLALPAGVRRRRRRVDQAGGCATSTSGETRFPLIMQNIHRYFWYFAVVFAGCSPGTRSRRSASPTASAWGSAPSSSSSTPCSSGPTPLGCHSCRHLCGGGLVKRFSKAKGRHWFWKNIATPLNAAPPAVRLAVAHLDHRWRTSTSTSSRAAPSTTRGSSDDRARSATISTSSSSAPGAPGCAPRSRRSATGARTAVVCKSLLGKAHTVMAEGGVAAALGNVWPEDNWKVHFRDTMRGGKMLNNWRMAQLHAQEAPDRVLELEEWGALFDRTPDGRILQRDFGGHRYARLAHVGDRTGLELLRTRPAPRRRPRHRGLHGVQDHPPPAPTTTAPSTAPSASGGSRASSSSSAPSRSCSPRAASARPGSSPRTPGSRPATATRSRCGPGPT